MRVSRQKSNFFKESVDFLGFVVTKEGTRTSQDKVKAIKEFKQPSNLFELRSTLKDRELNYATNERELLAIVWALDSLRHYLYGKSDINIFTDHQPLIFAVSDKNPNSKLKRWKARIEESGAKVIYKPGKENGVADALSRQGIYALQSLAESDRATIPSEESLTLVIESTEKPLNCFRNQIVLEEASTPNKRLFIVFGSKTRHQIDFSDW
ncbi:hypothetical protein KR018_002083, partial [Drosophila ironensis]